MAANKFATMLHRNTNKLTLILVYALLEWILIIALLINSLFWYLIVKFAEYFGLKKPCLFCSRLDHVFEPDLKSSYRDLVCEAHGYEISELGFCLNHRKLVESKDMCVDCSGLLNKIDFVKLGLGCSCCGVDLDSKLFSPYFVIKPSWDVLDYTQKVNLIGEKRVDHKIDDLDLSRSDEHKIEERDDHDDDERKSLDDDESPEILPQDLEFVIDGHDYQLIPVDMADSIVVESRDFVMDFDLGDAKLEDNFGGCSAESVALLSSYETVEEAIVSEEKSVDFGEIIDGFSGLNEVADLIIMEECEQVPISADVHQEWKEDVKMWSDETEPEVSIGTEIPDHEPVDEYQNQEDPSTSYAELDADDDHGLKQIEERFVEFKTISVETSEQYSGFNEIMEDKVPDTPTENRFVEFKTISVQMSERYSGFSEIEEDKFPDTPTSVESYRHLSRRRELGTEDSLDSSVSSEIDGGDGVCTVEKLTSALKAERKALNALYAELEEERNASAVAANQTMAMINRLQEEKAAMQMEGLQYQRMMDEQSEYDQEALQLLNELMVKREKENQELEKELEMYRKKVLEYEAKQKAMLRRKDGSSRSRNSSSYCSNAEDSDGLSIDLNHEKEEDGYNSTHESNNNSTPVDAVLYLEESLSNFEEERMSILEQLKVLEEKLFTLSDEEDQHFEDIKPIENFREENGNGYHDNIDIGIKTNGMANGHFKELNGKHQNGGRLDIKAKRLLPLFDAIDSETDEHWFDSSPTRNSSSTLNHELDNKKLAIEEEVDHVYERLQALEADREFLKHCMNSLRKGDKGIHLLQEILQHLCDLRSVEQHCSKSMDAAIL